MGNYRIDVKGKNKFGSFSVFYMGNIYNNDLFFYLNYQFWMQ